MWNVKAKQTPVITTATGTLFKIPQTIPEKHNGKARNRGITETSHIGHCTQTVESANVKVQNIFHSRNNIMCNTNSEYRTVATLSTLQTRFVSGT